MALQLSDQDYEMHVLLISKSRLKSSIGTSTLMAGFALVAMVEVDVNPGTPHTILIPFAILTALLIFVNLFSLVIATRLLPELEATIHQPSLKLTPTVTKGYVWPVQLVWYLSNIVGVLLFLVELILVAYVKFYPYEESLSDRIYVGTGTLVVVVGLSVVSSPFVVWFFRSISTKKIKIHEEKLRKAKDLLENIKQSAEATAIDIETGSVDSYQTNGSYNHEQILNRNTSV